MNSFSNCAVNKMHSWRLDKNMHYSSLSMRGREYIGSKYGSFLVKFMCIIVFTSNQPMVIPSLASCFRYG